MENSSTNFRLSVCVVFGNTMSGSVEVQDDGSWKVSGPMMTTQMMPPSDIYGNETFSNFFSHFFVTFFQKLKNEYLNSSKD